MKNKNLVEKLTSLYHNFLDLDNELLVEAEKAGTEELLVISRCFVGIAEQLKQAAYGVSSKVETDEVLEVLTKKNSEKKESSESEEDEKTASLRSLSELASILAESNDISLQKTSSMIDNILLTLAIDNAEKRANFNKQFADKIAEIKAKKDSHRENNDKIKQSFHGQEAIDAVDKQLKHYVPMEAPLKTRTCPDHPGYQIQRISDDVYQCSLDKKTYDFKAGFTTLNGNKVPGTSVEMQSQVPLMNINPYPGLYMDEKAKIKD